MLYKHKNWLKLLVIAAWCADILALLPIYQKINDLRHPTTADYEKIQRYLATGDRPHLHRLRDTYSQMRNFKIIDSANNQIPQRGTIAINSSVDERENCILIYASLNGNFKRGLERLITLLRASDFKGHILWMLGGWPDVEGGSLGLAHVPYAFKACFFKEAQRLGYERAFWLDTSLIPCVSMNKLFDVIKQKGYFVVGNTHTIGYFFCQEAADALKVSLQESYHIPSCSAGICGYDFTSEIGRTIVDRWYQAAWHAEAFYSQRSDQNALSVILWQLHVHDLTPISLIAHNQHEINEHTLFIINRGYVR